MSDVCDRYVPVICALKDANAALSVGTEVATGVCAVVGLASFATTNPLFVGWVAKFCAPVLAALGVARTVGYFVDSISMDVRLGSDKTALRGTEETATISAFVTFSGLQELCGTVTSSDYAGDIVGWVAAGIVRLLLKKSVLLSKSHRILKRKSLEKFITTTFGSVLGAVLTRTGLDRAFVEGARALCYYVGFGQTDADLRFRLQADVGRFNLQVSNGGRPTPKNDGSGTYRLACPPNFTGTLTVAGNKNLCGENRLDTIRVSCSTGCPLAPDDEVHIPDARLRSMVERALRRAPGAPIYPAEMASIAGLDSGTWPDGRKVSDLTGLECATGLRILDLALNEISDLSPLSGLTDLTELNLIGNRVTDLSPLSDLVALERLFLLGGGNRVEDVSHLSRLTAMKTLQLASNGITHVSALSGMKDLEYLGLSHNRIVDVSPLSGMTALTELNLNGNEISSVSPLSGMTALTRLDARNNEISSVSALSGMTVLVWLDLSRNRISNVSPLSGLTSLERLVIDDNEISDIGPLVSNRGLGDGDLVFLSGNPLSDLSRMTHIPALEARGVSVSF